MEILICPRKQFSFFMNKSNLWPISKEGEIILMIVIMKQILMLVYLQIVNILVYKKVSSWLYAKRNISMLVMESASITDDSIQFLKYIIYSKLVKEEWVIIHIVTQTRFNIYIYVLSPNRNMVLVIINSLNMFRNFYQINITE